MTQDGTSFAVATEDGAELAVTAFEAAGGGHSRPALLIFPAMGAPAKAYFGFAAHMAAKGYPTIAVDPRGSGASPPRPSRREDYGVDAHLDHDWPAVIAWARGRHGERALVLIGHSFGGHLSSLYAGLNPGQAQALVLLATSDLNYRNWGFPRALVVRLNFAIFALIARLLGYLPGHRLGWGAPIARQVILDWADWGLTARYRGSQGQDLGAALDRIEAPVLAISFHDDTRLGPKRAIDGFCARLSAAAITRWHLAPGDIGRVRVGHFGHLKESEQLWDRLDAWLEDTIPGCD
jgi:predicted alpha/beta hydrolase